MRQCAIATVTVLLAASAAQAQWIYPEAPQTKPGSQSRAVDVGGAPAPELDPGWRWAVPVHPVWMDNIANPDMLNASPFEGGVLHASFNKAGSLEIIVATAGKAPDSPSERKQYRVLLLDQDGETIWHNGIRSLNGSESRIEVHRWDDPEKFEKGRWLGLAVLDYEGRLERASAHADAVAESGMRFPVVPKIGEPFTFDLPLIGGGRLTHEDLRGKIVVFDAWATWCGPCMQKMPEMRKLRDKYAAHAVEIVGINLEHYDSEAEQHAQKAIEQHELDWRHIAGSHSADSARLWHNVTGIDSIPRIFIVDREGILRADRYPGHWMPDFLAELIEEQPVQAAASD